MNTPEQFKKAWNENNRKDGEPIVTPVCAKCFGSAQVDLSWIDRNEESRPIFSCQKCLQVVALIREGEMYSDQMAMMIDLEIKVNELSREINEIDHKVSCNC